MISLPKFNNTSLLDYFLAGLFILAIVTLLTTPVIWNFWPDFLPLDVLIQLSVSVSSVLFSAALVVAYLKLVGAQNNQTDILEQQQDRLRELEKPELVIENWKTIPEGLEACLSNVGGGRATRLTGEFSIIPVDIEEGNKIKTIHFRPAAIYSDSDIDAVPALGTLKRSDTEGGSNAINKNEKGVEYYMPIEIYDRNLDIYSFHDLIAYYKTNNISTIGVDFVIKYKEVASSEWTTVSTGTYIVEVESVDDFSGLRGVCDRIRPSLSEYEVITDSLNLEIL